MSICPPPSTRIASGTSLFGSTAISLALPVSSTKTEPGAKSVCTPPGIPPGRSSNVVPVALVSLLNETRQVVRTLSPLGVVTTVGNDVAQEISKEIAQFYIDKAREYFDPLAWVPDNQRVYVHFDGGVTLPIEQHELGRTHEVSTTSYSAYR